MSNSKKRVRESKDYAKFYGFNMKPGFLFGVTPLPVDGTTIECDWVYAGKKRIVKKPDGTRDHSEVMLFVKSHIPQWEANQAKSHNDTWEKVWINADRGIGHKIISKKVNIIPDARFTGKAPGAFYKDCRQIGDNIYNRYNSKKGA
ncbi:MAG: hypothetical protein ACI4JW_07920 [Oscillospiraceae bacterium]